MAMTIDGTNGVTFPDASLQTKGVPSYVRQLAQTVIFTTGAAALGTTAIPADNTIPQSNEGDQFMSLAITPVSATSTLVIDVVLYGNETSNTSNYGAVSLFRDAGTDALKTGCICLQFTGGGGAPLGIIHQEQVSGSTATTTFKVRAGSETTSGFQFNGGYIGQLYGGTLSSFITIKEYLA